MKLTLANIKELKRNSSSPLTKRVCNYVIDEWSDYSDKKNIFTDVLYHGCQSGIVGELIYYTDRKIRLHRIHTIKTCWHGSALKKHLETSLTTLNN